MSINFLDYKNKKSFEETSSNDYINVFTKLEKELKCFNIDMDSLNSISPKYTKNRITLIECAKKCCLDEKIVKYTLANGRVPLKRISFLTLLNFELLKKYNTYLLVLILIFSSNDYELIQNIIQNNENFNVINNHKKGFVLKVSKKSALLLCPLGEFAKVSITSSLTPKVGQLYEGKVFTKKPFFSFKHNKLTIISTLFISLVIVLAIIFNNPTSTSIIVDISSTGYSSVKMHPNKWNKIVSVTYLTPKSKQDLGKASLKMKDVNSALISLIETALKNGRLSKDELDSGVKVKIFISNSETLINLNSFQDYLHDKKLPYEINNNGTLITME